MKRSLTVKLREIKPLQKPEITEEKQAEIKFCESYEKFVSLLNLSGIEEHMLEYLINKAIIHDRTKRFSTQ